MGRTALIPTTLASLATVQGLFAIDRQGFWFDEAFSARIGALPWARLLAAASQDIHPPGWPVLAGLTLRTGLPEEVALRLPSTLAWGYLVGLVASRNPLAGAALLFYGPLMEQATQGRPYLLLAAGLVSLVHLVERRWWLLAGLVGGLVASLHALGLALTGLVLCGAILPAVPAGVGDTEARPSGTELLRLLAPLLALTAPWLPSFAASARHYLGNPWYQGTGLSDLWLVSDAGGAVVAAGAALVVGGRRQAPAVFVILFLVASELAGVGVEVRKTGLVVLPLLLARLPKDRRGWIAGAVALASLAIAVAPQPTRPDLRAAKAAAASLDPTAPVFAVFASEASWYFRDPAPLPSFRTSEDIARRAGELLDAQGVPCLISVALPGTFPDEDRLPGGLRTKATAEVAGLDVRLLGTTACHPAPPAPPPL